MPVETKKVKVKRVVVHEWNLPDVEVDVYDEAGTMAVRCNLNVEDLMALADSQQTEAKEEDAQFKDAIPDQLKLPLPTPAFIFEHWALAQVEMVLGQLFANTRAVTAEYVEMSLVSDLGPGKTAQVVVVFW